MAIKELQTRIALKYDSYENWKDSELVLLPGEIGICAIGDTDATGKGEATTNPTVLFKVGDGVTPFKTLKWASALAADVHGWAKASDVVLDGKTIKFVGTDKTVVLNYATPEEVAAAVKVVADKVDGLTTRVASLEGLFGEGENTIDSKLEAIDGRLDVIEGEGEGSVKKALVDAKAYTDEREAAIKTAYEAYANQAEADAKTYADGLNTAMDTRVDDLEAAKADHETRIGNNTAAINTINNTTIPGVVSGYEAADLAINNKIGTAADGKDEATVYGAIAKAKADAAEDAATKVKALEDGQVATNKTDIAGLTTRIGNEETARANADTALDNRLTAVETFFKTAEGETINDALDTLVEIQKYITEDGTAADEMIKDIAANASAIEALQGIVNEGGTLEVRVDNVEEKAINNANAITTLQQLTSGYTGEKAIYNRVEEVAGVAAQGVSDAATAKSAADAAQGDATQALADAKKAQEEVDALEGVVNGVKTTAEDAQTRVGAVETRIGTAEGNITGLKAIVETGDNSNDKLRSAITTLQTLTGDAAKGNEALYTEVTRVAGLVDDANTGLAKTKEIADGAATQAETNRVNIAAIAADYLKEADLFIFNCGSATTVTHEAPKN